MSQATTQYRRSVSGSVGAGMRSVFSAGGRRYYTLVHKTGSQYHQSGESQPIIVDEIELGRDAKCQVRYDESFSTVSRRHAAIVRDGENWKLVQLSHTNPTYLNGNSVQREWYLQNGDEIQLSTNGPRLGFIVPEGEKGKVSSIGLTARLNLFGQQALRPYKQAISAMAAFILVVLIGGGVWGYNMTQDSHQKDAEIAAQRTALDEQDKRLMEQAEQMITMRNSVEEANKRAAKAIKEAEEARKYKANEPARMAQMFAATHPYIYFIQATAKHQGEVVGAWRGTGFMLDDGKFVTARHVVSPYYSNSFDFTEDGFCATTSDPEEIMADLILNVWMQSGDLDIEYVATSVKDEFRFTQRDVRCDSSKDKIYTFPKVNALSLFEGVKIRIGALGDMDYAYVQTNRTHGLKAARSKSTSLQQGTTLYILGYPHGWAAKDAPILSTATCSQTGLSRDFEGTIMASNNNTESGNSGGPIFIQTEDGLEVVAIVSGRNYEKGRFVPMSKIP